MKTQGILAMGGALLLLVVIAPVAQAETVNLRYQQVSGGYVGARIGTTTSYDTVGGTGGLFTLKIDTDLDEVADDKIYAWCIEMYERIPSEGWCEYTKVAAKDAPESNTGTNAGIVGPMTADGEAAVRKLVAQAFDGTTSWTAGNRLAFQAALWEIVYEYAHASAPTLDIGNGFYRISSTKAQDGTSNTAVLNQAQQWLTDLTTSTASYDGVMFAYSNENCGPNQEGLQDFLRIVPVPLPPAALMGLALLGGLGVAARRRRRNAA